VLPKMMELRNAIEKANQILNEERLFPTVRYNRLAETKRKEQLEAVAQAKAKANHTRPRAIVEDPSRWIFESTNYALLCALSSQLPATSRPAFLGAVLQRATVPPACAVNPSHDSSAWNGFTSDLPLVAEFCVRNGGKQDLFRVLGEASGFPGHVHLLRHLEDMIALNLTVFTYEEYEYLDKSVATLGYTARKRLHEYTKAALSRAGQLVRVHGAELDLDERVCREIVVACNGIREECRRARYLHLKKSLLEGFNLEINQDKNAVETYLQRFHFSDTLIQCLNEVDRLYLDPTPSI